MFPKAEHLNQYYKSDDRERILNADTGGIISLLREKKEFLIHILYALYTDNRSAQIYEILEDEKIFVETDDLCALLSNEKAPEDSEDFVKEILLDCYKLDNNIPFEKDITDMSEVNKLLSELKENV